MPLLIYTALRIALILVVWVVLRLVGLTAPLWFAVAVVVALLLSYVAFRGPRDRAGTFLAERSARRREHRFSAAIDADADFEDTVVDSAAESSTEPTAEPGGDEPAVEPSGDERPAADAS